MKYLINNPLSLKIIRSIDTLVRLLPKKAGELGSVRKILVSNLAHLGDVVLATSVIKPLRKAYPGVEIGFLTGSWSAPIVAPLVDQVHIFDHYRLNRDPKNKMQRHRDTKRQALKEIKGYDLSIDLYPYFPNSIYLSYQANIPVRVGFTSGGFGPLLTHPLDFEERGHLTEHYAALLKLIGVNGPMVPSLKEVKARSGDYIVLHPGTGHVAKQWPPEYWRELAELFLATGQKLIVTGRGEKALVDKIVHGLDGIENLCDQLSFDELLSVVKGAKRVICGDTVIGHIANAYNVPKSILYSGINDYTLWHKKEDILMQEVSCSPCKLKNGCAAKTCLRGLFPKQVFYSCK
ncbi:MAG: hypothetical protein SP1CHLAM54_15130 [Chlamydiia bacterium]|nr:hypothetical protein [Chlamydiia bacterium]MCH9616403.1 hypothetical protein [Chlamydiia bacterium]MCH9629611.1 hypothetical protein [Chlamydiia bacterium]